jgi:hypothetical protein
LDADAMAEYLSNIVANGIRVFGFNFDCEEEFISND